MARMAGAKMKQRKAERAAKKQMAQGGPGMGLAQGYGNEQMSGSGPRKAPNVDGFANMLIEAAGNQMQGVRR